jgi:hypothetical protein
VRKRLAGSSADRRAFNDSDIGLTSTRIAERIAHSLHYGIVLRAGTWVQQDGYPLHGDERDGCAPRVRAVDNTTP